MKRAKALLPQIIDPENLRWAYLKARKGKSYSREVREYALFLDDNLFSLHRQLASGLVEVGNYKYFTIFDPKERKICASAFSEQVLHHALMNICDPYFERAQIYDSYASRKGKGTYAALARAREHTKKYTWYLKLDVRKFFESIHHLVLKEQLHRMFKEPVLLDIYEKIIDSYEVEPLRGVPIGNLSSQYFANHYLSPLDHFIKEDLRSKAYVRYMDDMVLWGYEKHSLLEAFNTIDSFVEQRLKVKLKPMILNTTNQGLSFLGYRIFPRYIHLSQRSKRRFLRKLEDIDNKLAWDIWDEATCRRHADPLTAFILHADTEKFRKDAIFRGAANKK